MGKTKTVKAWLAKDANGKMFLHAEKPEWRKAIGFGDGWQSDKCVYVDKLFDKKLLKKGECKEIEITIVE